MKPTQTGVAVGKTFREIFKSWRAWAAMFLTILLVLTVTTLLRSNAGRLDPHSPAPLGTQAFFRILQQHVPHLEFVKSADEMPVVTDDTTVVFVNNRLNAAWAVETVFAKAKGAARIILIDPSADQFAAVGISAYSVSAPPTEQDYVEKGRCPVNIFGEVTTVTAPREVFSNDTARPPLQCFLHANTSAVGIWPAADALINEDGEEIIPAHPQVVAFASGEWFTNRLVSQAQNGALGVTLMAQTPKTLVMYLDRDAVRNNANNTEDNSPDSLRLFPAWVKPAYYLIGVAVLFVIAYKRSRFGRLAFERLPITVKSLETIQALGRLYEQNKATARATQLLQQDALQRLRKTLYQTSQTTDAQLIAIVAARTQLPEVKVNALLLQPFTGSTKELASFSKELDALIQEVTND